MRVICAFSSDFRPLYKADIYRALALPEGHVLHFRYKRKYVDDNLLSPSVSLARRKVVIFYTHGNKESVGSLTHVSIREGTIVDSYFSSDTDVMHVFMKLGGFCNVRVDTVNSSEKMPLTKFFAELECTTLSEDQNWQARVNTISELLPPLTYFQIKGISSGGTKLKLRYSGDGRSCFYRLMQGDRHLLHLALGNPKGTTAKIGISDSGDDIAINVIRPMETSAQFDDVDVPLIVQNLQVFKKPALLTFQPISEGNEVGEYATNVELELHGGFRKPILFGFLSLVAIVSILVVQPRNPTSIFAPTCVLFLAAIFFWAATSILYYWFNKK